MSDRLRFPSARRPCEEQKDAPGAIDAVVVDEHDEPLERITGAQTLNVSADEMAIRTPYPLMPGLKLMVLVTDPRTPDAQPSHLELQVLACSPWLGAHWVRTRILHRQVPQQPRLAA